MMMMMVHCFDVVVVVEMMTVVFVWGDRGNVQEHIPK